MKILRFEAQVYAEAVRDAWEVATFNPPYPRQWHTPDGAPIPGMFTAHHYEVEDGVMRVADTDAGGILAIAHEAGIACLLEKPEGEPL